MATLEQIAAQLVTLRNELNESRRREEDLNNRLQAVQSTGAMQAALQEMVNTQKAILEASKKPDKKLTLVDNRGLAKPSNFDGNSDFLQWKIRLEAFVESVHGDFGQAMAWAEDETDPISNASMNAEFGETTPAQETIPDLESKDAQLYAVLQTLCEKEAFTLVRSAGKGKGLEAWRRLCKRFDPSTGGRRRALLRSVLSPNRCNKVEELSAAVENWEDQVRQYENRRKADGSRPTLDEDIKISILESICPVEVERHLQLNQARFADYLEVRKELSTYLETRIGLKLKSGGGHSSSDYNGPQPMDIGALAGGDKKKSATCHNCSKLGHFKSECWAPGGGKANSKGTSKGKGPKGSPPSGPKGSKGSPKGKGGSKGGGKKGGKKGSGKGKGKGGKAIGSVEAEKEPEGEEQAGSWDAAGWDEGDSGWYGDWTEDPGSNPEGNSLVLGALHRTRSNMGSKRPASKKEESKEAQKKPSYDKVHLGMDLAAAMKRVTSADFGRTVAEGQGKSSVADSGAGSSGDRSVDVMMRLIEENYKLRDQLKRQEEKETRGRSRSPKRGRSPKKVKRESTDEEEGRIIRENKRRDRSKSRHRERSASTTESRKEFLKLADKTTYPKSAPPRRARSTKPERKTPKGSVGDFIKQKATRSEETPTASDGGPQKASDGTSPKKPDAALASRRILLG